MLRSAHSILAAICGLAVAGILAAPNPASAGITYVFSTTSSVISQGESITESLTVNVSPDPQPVVGGYNYSAYFLNGTVTLNSGDTSWQSFSISSYLNTETFSQTFAYQTPGTYNPNFSLNAVYAEQGIQTYLFNSGFLSSSTPLQVTTAVPEPSTWAMMILGFAGIGFMAYRRKVKASDGRLIRDHMNASAKLVGEKLSTALRFGRNCNQRPNH